MLHLDEANMLAQELGDRKKQLKAAMFDNKLASLSVFPTIGLGELIFAHVQLPFNKVDFASSEFKSLDIPAGFYSFVLPLNNGERIVAFRRVYDPDQHKYRTHMSCYDRLDRLIFKGYVESAIKRNNAVQCGPTQFVANLHNPSPHQPNLSVYDWDLHCMRTRACKNFVSICCNSKFVFGLWNHSDDDRSSQMIVVHHLDTLSEASGLRLLKEYTVKRIMANEHRVVALSNLKESEYLMSVFDLQGTGNDRSGDDKRAARRFSLPERHFPLGIESPYSSEVFLVDDWLVVPTDQHIFWYNKEGHRSETAIELNRTAKSDTIYTSRSVLLFDFTANKKLTMKRL